MSHQRQDDVSLEMARRVTERLRASPELLAIARDNLDRWSRQNSDSPLLLRCYAEWQAILERPIEEICSLLCAESEEGQRLRQNSPFAGILSPAEVWEIKSRVRSRHATTPA
jgi:hypothetical protein